MGPVGLNGPIGPYWGYISQLISGLEVRTQFLNILLGVLEDGTPRYALIMPWNSISAHDFQMSFDDGPNNFDFHDFGRLSDGAKSPKGSLRGPQGYLRVP